MLLRSLKAIVETQAQHSAADAWLGGLGVSTAVASACFAGYMMLTGPADVAAHGTDQFTVFVPFDRRAPAVAAQDRQRPAAAAPAREPGLDFTPTGTVPGQQTELAEGQDGSGDDRASMQDFAVRDVFDGTAMIEAHGALQLVKPGTTLEGAGKVLAIQRKGDAWVVVTEGGVIGQRH